MSPFQLAGLTLSLGVSSLLLASALRGRIRLRGALPWIGLWCASAVAFAWPDATGVVARKLGVDRGADLISYLSVLAMLAGFFLVSLRLRGLNRQITLLVRQLAISDAERNLEATREEPLPAGPAWDEE